MITNAIVLGGCGFIGRHLVRRLRADGANVLVVDNNSTSSPHPDDGPVLRWDIRQPLPVPYGHTADVIFNLACPASPRDYAREPFYTLETCAMGTRNGLRLADELGAVFVQASTSEVYGDPLVHPQREDYYGNVNPVGPRACYDEGKRFAEALAMNGPVHIRIARIFNTYGPGMRPNDGRVLPAFIDAALRSADFPVYGDGTQTRSFCYVSDLVDGLVRLYERGDESPVNLGNPHEVTLIELADIVRRVVGTGGQVRSVRALPENDPKKRRPDITRARQLLNWEPKVALEDGIRRMVEDLKPRK